MSGHKLSAVDSAWLRMEDPTNLMTITGVMTFKEVVEFQRVKRLIEDKLLDHPRFRRKVVEARFGGPRWEDDDYFALSHHLHRTALPGDGGKEQLEELVSRLMSTPLDYARPLWQFHFIDNFKGGSALVLRVHHCVGDGMSLMKVTLDLAESQSEAPTTVGHAGRQTGALGSGPSGSGSSSSGPSSSGKRSFTETLLHEGAQVLADPSRIMELWKTGGEAARVLGRLLALPADTPTPLRGRLGTQKRCVWSRPIPLQGVKDIGKALGATVNDVLMSAVAGALRRYLIGRGHTPFADMRVVVPVNLRPLDDFSLGNKFGLVFLALPVGVEDPRERLRQTKERMDAIKESPEAFVAFGVLQALGMTTTEIEEMVLNLFGQKATGVATNVPGPRSPLLLAGSEVDGLMFWVPQSGRLGLGVSVLSYSGQVRIGIATDTGLAPDPHSIVEGYHLALEELMASAEAAS